MASVSDSGLLRDAVVPGAAAPVLLRFMVKAADLSGVGAGRFRCAQFGKGGDSDVSPGAIVGIIDIFEGQRCGPASIATMAPPAAGRAGQLV
jgi:hypothetical protein